MADGDRLADRVVICVAVTVIVTLDADPDLDADHCDAVPLRDRVKVPESDGDREADCDKASVLPRLEGGLAAVNAVASTEAIAAAARTRARSAKAFRDFAM